MHSQGLFTAYLTDFGKLGPTVYRGPVPAVIALLCIKIISFKILDYQTFNVFLILNIYKMSILHEI